MNHVATALFFILVLVGAGASLQRLLADHGAKILAALRNEVPKVRRTRQVRWSRVRVLSRPYPAAARPIPWRAAV